MGRGSALLGRDDARLRHDLAAGHGQRCLGRDLLGLGLVLRRRVARPVLLAARMAGEHDQLGLVGAQARHIDVEGLLAAVLAAEVDGDADAQGSLLGDADGLELIQREALPGPNLTVVLERLAANRRPQQVDGTWSDLGRLGLAGDAPCGLLGRLIEPCLDVLFPVFVEVPVGHLVLCFTMATTTTTTTATTTRSNENVDRLRDGVDEDRCALRGPFLSLDSATPIYVWESEGSDG